MKKNKGQNLSETAILLGVIALVCIASYTLLGNNVNELFKYSSTKFQEYKPFPFLSNGNNGGNPGSGLTTPGQWNGGVGNPPVSKCINGVCDIDFGDYILTGIPENFADFTASNGSSGGNDKIYALSIQLANQLESKGDGAGAQDLRDFANLAKYMGSLQKILEDQAKSCTSNSDPAHCLALELANDSGINVSVPSELSHIFHPIPEISSISGQLFLTELGESRNFKNTLPDYFSPSNNPRDGFVAMYDKIVNNPKYANTSLTGIVKELYLNVGDINSNFYDYMNHINNDFGFGSFDRTKADPLTGVFTTEPETKTMTTLDQLIHPDITANKNLTGALTCASKNYQNAETVCHNK